MGKEEDDDAKRKKADAKGFGGQVNPEQVANILTFMHVMCVRYEQPLTLHYIRFQHLLFGGETSKY